jgi:hypothetical protein
MDDNRFDWIAKTVQSRRVALGLAAGVLAMLGLADSHESAARCKKTCGPCKRCKKGKCKPKPFGTSCGACRRCEGGRCIALCQSDEGCSNGICTLRCEPPCQGDEDCFYGVCYARCDPRCASDEGCVNGACEDQTGGCGAPDDWCADAFVVCPDVGAGYGCVLTNAGEPFCAESIGCSSPGTNLCQSDTECRIQGWGPNARCIFACSECDGGNACAASYLDFLGNQAEPIAAPRHTRRALLRRASEQRGVSC